jgi:hypothetical protein
MSAIAGAILAEYPPSTQRKLASDQTDKVYGAEKRWLVLNAIIAHIGGWV